MVGKRCSAASVGFACLVPLSFLHTLAVAKCALPAWGSPCAPALSTSASGLYALKRNPASSAPRPRAQRPKIAPKSLSAWAARPHRGPVPSHQATLGDCSWGAATQRGRGKGGGGNGDGDGGGETRRGYDMHARHSRRRVRRGVPGPESWRYDALRLGYHAVGYYALWGKPCRRT